MADSILRVLRDRITARLKSDPRARLKILKRIASYASEQSKPPAHEKLLCNQALKYQTRLPFLNYLLIHREKKDLKRLLRIICQPNNRTKALPMVSNSGRGDPHYATNTQSFNRRSYAPLEPIVFILETKVFPGMFRN